MRYGMNADEEFTIWTKGLPVGARLSTFDAKNRRFNGPRNCTFAIIKEAIDLRHT